MMIDTNNSSAADPAKTKVVTLADVARESNVSMSTVSMVLRKKPGFPEETRHRVLDAAQALGYKSPNAASLSRGRTRRRTKLHTLGLIIKSDARQMPYVNPFYSYVLAGIEDACRRKHINLLYATLPVDEHNRPVDTPRLLLDEITDGVLLIGAFVDTSVDSLLKQIEMPVVLVDAYAVADHYDSVLTDNVRGAYQAVQHLVQAGHRHIALVGTTPDAYPSVRDRRTGYLQALRDNRITAPYYTDCEMDSRRIAAPTADLLHKHPEVTALFCSNDEVAIAAMRTAQEIGLSVPDDLSIIGFDDIDMAGVVSPGLTTMHVDKVGMGRIAVQLLGARVEFPGSERINAALSVHLMSRQTVAAPRHRKSISMVDSQSDSALWPAMPEPPARPDTGPG